MVTIIDYDAGNLRNVQKAFEYHGCEARISSRLEEIDEATTLVLPGVGHFQHGMDNLEKTGLDDLIRKKVLEEQTPILGICLGIQLLSEVGYEDGERQGLGLLKMESKPIKISDKKYRSPHIGWNSVEILPSAKLFQGVPDSADFYFVHSYAVEVSNPDIISSRCTYDETFVASVEYKNIYATQFHPEKSQIFGLQVIKNFIDISKESGVTNSPVN
jgi:glutamine amidotransferase